MTNLITLTIPNDDHVALRAFGKALEEMALAHGAESKQSGIWVDQQFNIHQSAEAALAADQTDTTAQQVESLAIPVEANGATYETDFVSDNPQAVPVADSTGTQWDERIHSASKALNTDGTWRLRRKPKDMDEAEWVYFVDEVKNELMGIDAEDLKEFEESKQATIEPPVTPPGDDFHSDAGVVTEQTVVGIPPIPVPPPVVVPPVREVSTENLSKALAVPYGESEQWDFPKLMKFLTERHGRITVEQVNALLAVDGLAALTDLNTHPDKIGPFVARVKAHLGE